MFRSLICLTFSVFFLQSSTAERLSFGIFDTIGLDLDDLDIDLPLARPPKFEKVEQFSYNVSLYGPWSEWGECQPANKCSQTRERKCLDESYLEISKDSDISCPVKLIIEKRKCEDDAGKAACVKYQEERRRKMESLKQNCGLPVTVDAQTRIAGGRKVLGNRWPWMLSLSLSDGKKSHLCGATLVSPKHVITAAHCLDSIGYITKNEWVPIEELSAGGEMSLKTVNGTMIPIKAAILHPEWDPKKLLSTGYDVAILKIDTDVDGIMPACMAFSFEKENKDDLECWIVGYGQTPSKPERRPRPSRRPSFDFDIFENMDSIFGNMDDNLFFGDFFFPRRRRMRGDMRLQSFVDPVPKRPSRRPNRRDRDENRIREGELNEAQVPIQNLESCEALFGRLREDRHICAGGLGKDTCQGDSGGGLYCKKTKDTEDQSWYIYGVTSFGSSGCSNSRKPRRTVYASVPGAQKWLEETLLGDY